MSDSTTSTNKYPAASEEVAKMLGLDKTDQGHAEAHDSKEVHAADDHSSDTNTHLAAPAELPVADLALDSHVAETAVNEKSLKKANEAALPSKPAATQSHLGLKTHAVSAQSVEEELVKAGIKSPQKPGVLNVLKTLLPYVLVFAAGLMAYFFYFSKVDFSKLFQKKPKTVSQTVSPKETVLSQLEKSESEGYKLWVNQFYFDVSDPKIIDPEVDNSGNGLSNFQKYLLKLNPKSYDTLGLGMADSEAIAKGINPLTGNALTEQQKQIIDKYFDMEVITNRLTLNQLHKAQVAGSSFQPQNSGQGNNQASSGQNNSGSSLGVQTQYVAPNTGANLNTPDAGSIAVDTETVGQLEVPSLKISAPIIWTKDTKDFNKDLQSGVIHYPGTAMPGQIGTTYISGHSSNYAWAKGSYNQIFATLGKLALNSSFQITVKQTNGQMATLHYVVISSKEYLPADQEQFKNTGKSVVALSTCWPVGSTAKRLVVVGELTQIEK